MPPVLAAVLFTRDVSHSKPTCVEDFSDPLMAATESKAANTRPCTTMIFRAESPESFEMSANQASLLLASGDLIVGTTVNNHAQTAGFDVDRCLSATKALTKLSERSYPVVVLELGLEGLDIKAVKVAAGDATVIGFVGHVRGDLIDAAKACGVIVCTNGQIHSQGEAIFRELRSKLPGIDEPGSQTD